MARSEMSATQIAALIAAHYGTDVEHMSYQWNVDYDTGEFCGVLLFDNATPAKK